MATESKTDGIFKLTNCKKKKKEKKKAISNKSFLFLRKMLAQKRRTCLRRGVTFHSLLVTK